MFYMQQCFSKEKSNTTSTTSNSLNNLENNNNIIDLDEPDDNYENELCEEFEKEAEAEQIISFNLLIKPATGPSLPSKWLKIEISSLDDILADIHHYVVKLTGDKEIMHSDYLVSFKPEKAGGVRAQLVDIQDYKKFLSDYKKLLDKKRNMVIIISLKKKKQKKKVNCFF